MFYFKKKRKAISILEALLVLAIVASLLVDINTIIEQNFSSQNDTLMGSQMTQIEKATNSYVKIYYSQLIASTATGPIFIPVARSSSAQAIPTGPNSTLPSIQGAGLLDPDFISVNSYGQNLGVVITKNPNNSNQLLILGSSFNAGGANIVIPDNDLANTMLYITTGDGGEINSTNSNTIFGFKGKYQIPTSEFANSVFTFSSGTYQFYEAYNGINSQSQYLNRFATANNTGNTMNTNINMNGYSLNGSYSVDSNILYNSGCDTLNATSGTYATVNGSCNNTTGGQNDAGQTGYLPSVSLIGNTNIDSGSLNVLNGDITLSGNMIFYQYGNSTGPGGGGWFMNPNGFVKTYNNYGIYTSSLVEAVSGVVSQTYYGYSATGVNNESTQYYMDPTNNTVLNDLYIDGAIKGNVVFQATGGEEGVFDGSNGNFYFFPNGTTTIPSVQITASTGNVQADSVTSSFFPVGTSGVTSCSSLNPPQLPGTVGTVGNLFSYCDQNDTLEYIKPNP